MSGVDWVAKAKVRWPGCKALMLSDGGLHVSLGDEVNNAWPVPEGAWTCYKAGGHSGTDPVAAIEAAIRAQQAEARATLAGLSVWGVE